MRKSVVIIIPVGIALASFFGYLWYLNTLETPWEGMSCDQMIGFAKGPGHQELSEPQHLMFHKDLEPCITEDSDAGHEFLS